MYKGFTLDRDHILHILDISISGHATKALHWFQHKILEHQHYVRRK